MEKILDRFLRYIAIDTQADPNSESQPSAAKELNLSKLLCEELTAMGGQAELDEYGYVMATIPSNCGKDVPAIGFIAHVDTAPDAAGACTNPQIIENYDGHGIKLGDSGRVLLPEHFPHLNKCIGKTVVTTDGTTVLGADDKAGIAAILTMVETVIKENIPHGRIAVCFSPDEEIGHGAELLDLDFFGADYGFTVDGSGPEDIEAETFNAASATVKFNG